jgi:hypothetical protein
MKFNRKILVKKLAGGQRIPVRKTCRDLGCSIDTFYRIKRLVNTGHFAVNNIRRGRRKGISNPELVNRIVREAIRKPECTLKEIKYALGNNIPRSTIFDILTKNDIRSIHERNAAQIVLSPHILHESNISLPGIVLPANIKITNKARRFIPNSEIYTCAGKRSDRVHHIGQPGYLGLILFIPLFGVPKKWNIKILNLLGFVEMFSGFEIWMPVPIGNLDSAIKYFFQKKVMPFFKNEKFSLKTLAFSVVDFKFQNIIGNSKWRGIDLVEEHFKPLSEYISETSFDEVEEDSNKMRKKERINKDFREFRRKFPQMEKFLRDNHVSVLLVRDPIVGPRIIPDLKDDFVISWLRNNKGEPLKKFSHDLQQFIDKKNRSPRLGLFSYGRTPAETLSASMHLIP